MLSGNHDGLLVTVSFLVAALASFTALAMAARAARASGSAAVWTWRLGGGCAMGLGIWSMHFIGMLAYSLPIPLGYDVQRTLLSLGVAVGSSVFALWLVSLPVLPQGRLVAGALLMGMGIALMHYTGMAALNMQPGILWHRGWVAPSLLIAVAACWCALWVAFRLRSHPGHTALRLGAACLLGAGICGVHYAGMAAARFPAGSVCGALGKDDLPASSLAVAVGGVTLLILGLALALAWMEQRLETHLLRLRNHDLSNSLDDAQAELTRAALHDPLTHLPNRRLLQKHIERELLLAAQTRRRFAVMFIDLDGFKQVNDAWGHHTGDALLVAVSKRFSALLGPSDLLARLGGDEFVLVAGGHEVAGITALADRLLAALHPTVVEGQPLQVTASIGIALCPDHARTERQLMASADAAMYRAKAAGRNRHVLYQASMDGGQQQQQVLLDDLRAAMTRGRIQLLYQPKRDAAGQRTCGAVVQAQWRHPRHGRIPCDTVTALAQRGGLGGELRRWVLDEVCRQLGTWHRQGHADASMSLPLSALQPSAPALEQDVMQALARHRIPPGRVLLDVTADVLLQANPALVAQLEALLAQGLGLCLDRFAMDASGLSALKRLRATEFRIDPAYIAGLPASVEDQAVVAALVGLGHSLHMRVIADGVETPAQRDCLQRIGIDQLQGPLWPPLDADCYGHRYLHAGGRMTG